MKEQEIESKLDNEPEIKQMLECKSEKIKIDAIKTHRIINVHFNEKHEMKKANVESVAKFLQYSNLNDFNEFSYDKSKKTVCIMYSGGVDSTVLLMRAAIKGYNIIPVYIYIANNSSRAFAEMSVLIHNCEIINSHTNCKVFKPKVVMNFSTRVAACDMYPLSPIFMCGMHFIPHLKLIDKIELGYIETDHMTARLNEIKKIWELSSNAFIFDTSMEKQKAPPLKFPLSKKPKENILPYFNLINHKYFDNNLLYTTCSNPTSSILDDETVRIDECGLCEKCKAIKCANEY